MTSAFFFTSYQWLQGCPSQSRAQINICFKKMNGHTSGFQARSVGVSRSGDLGKVLVLLPIC